MKYIENAGQSYSVFSLGTVQLGMDYGLGDNTAKPTKEYAFQILDRAVEHGVNVLDTANNYGTSEEVIGEWLKMKSKEERPIVITKIGPFDHSSPDALRQDVMSQVEGCRKALGQDTLDVLMIHDFDDYDKDPVIMSELFAEMKAQGIIKKSGISTYSYHDYHKVAKSGFDTVQIALNVFDWQRINDGGIQALADAGMVIFARSVFLQGLVFFTPEKLAPEMSFCIPYINEYRRLCEKFKLSPSTLALSFALSVKGVSSVTLGCQTPEQIDSNCETLEKTRQLTNEEMSELHDAFTDIDPRVINPKLWFNAF